MKSILPSVSVGRPVLANCFQASARQAKAILSPPAPPPPAYLVTLFLSTFLQLMVMLTTQLFRTFLYSFSRNGAMFQLFLTFELPKLTFSCCYGCGFIRRRLKIWTISFIMLCNILILKCKYLERLSRNFQLFSNLRTFQAIFAPSNSYFTEYNRWVPLSLVKIVVLRITL